MAWFIPRNKKLYARMASLSPAMRLMISGGLVLIIFGLWYRMLYRPLENARAAYRTQTQEIMAKKRDLSMSQHLLEQAQAELLSLQAANCQLHSGKTLSSQDILLHVVETARAHNVRVTSCDVQKRDAGQQIAFKAQGSYEQIFNFFQTIAHDTSNITCDQLSLSAQKTGTLSVSCLWLIS